jgi:hypothetical protein
LFLEILKRKKLISYRPTYLLLGEGVGEVGVESLVLLQEVVREDGRVAVGDEPVVQLGGLVVQQDAGVVGGLTIKAQQRTNKTCYIRIDITCVRKRRQIRASMKAVLWIRIYVRIRMICTICFGPPGSASGSVSHKYGTDPASDPSIIKQN